MLINNIYPLCVNFIQIRCGRFDMIESQTFKHSYLQY